MDEGALLLTLEEAASRVGYRKRELRALVREGRLPAVRAGKRWQVSTSDLAMLPSRIAAPASTAPFTESGAPGGKNAEPMIALIDLLRERDQKLAELLEERSRLAGQVGFLLGQLSEREERIQWLEQAAFAASTRQSVSALPHEPAPIALIDEWTKPPSPDSAQGQNQPALFGARAPTLPRPAADTPAVQSSESVLAPPTVPAQSRRGVFGLFRRRAPG